MEFPPSQESTKKQLAVLINRLERLSADSHFAHLASGYRGALLRDMDRLLANETIEQEDMYAMQLRIEHSYLILESAAREIEAWKGDE